MELHEVIYQPGDRVLIVDDPYVPDGTPATVKRTGEKSKSGRPLILVRRHDGRGWTDDSDGELYCWHVYLHEIALDPEYMDYEEDE